MSRFSAALLILLAALIAFCAGVLWNESGKRGTYTVSGAQRFLQHSDTETAGLIDINRASAVELADLPGIGPVLAQRILEYRDANGSFAAPEDLLYIKGIGEKTLEKLLPYIIVTEVIYENTGG